MKPQLSPFVLAGILLCLPSADSFVPTARRWHPAPSSSSCPGRTTKTCMAATKGSETSGGTQGPSRASPSVPRPVAAFNKAFISTMKEGLFSMYGDRSYARFYALETIARVPYFAYTSVLHLYETLGWWRRADFLKIHFAESWNELHHLLIMEELGGNEKFQDRFLAQHAAFFYYWMVIFLYMTAPAVAYNLNEQVERHAYDTYNKFLEEHGDELKQLPAPKVAKEYYETGDLYMFDEFHTNQPEKRRRPAIRNLYDVFREVRDDEKEHYLTMEALQFETEEVVSPNTLAAHKRQEKKDSAGGSGGGSSQAMYSDKEDDGTQ